MRRRTWSDDQFIEAVRASSSIAEVLKRLGLTVAGSAYQTVHTNVERLGLDISHFTGQGWAKGRPDLMPDNKRPFSEILVENSTYTNTGNLKRRLLSAGMLEERCGACGLGPEWQGEKLTLQLDHVNGFRRDNRIDNLRLLCPNCHSQTSTFCRRSKGK